ncbi:LOW QUALITY PROTEIN: hypothetical protein V1478_013227 [Vespula squamosa]|uniref:Uncharacterized protein n=1 Tax=Vespula squamosa TaxID=30214 RepID=A0ABD2AA74_VESSQ
MVVVNAMRLFSSVRSLGYFYGRTSYVTAVKLRAIFRSTVSPRWKPNFSSVSAAATAAAAAARATSAAGAALYRVKLLPPPSPLPTSPTLAISITTKAETFDSRLADVITLEWSIRKGQKDLNTIKMVHDADETFGGRPMEAEGLKQQQQHSDSNSNSNDCNNSNLLWLLDASQMVNAFAAENSLYQRAKGEIEMIVLAGGRF